MKPAHYFLSLSIALASVVVSQAQTLPVGESDLFAGSGVCGDCHVPGGMNPTALVNSAGNDISPPSLWRSTMMANAARDPFWQAKVQAEISAHPELQPLIEDKCSTCHAPMGRIEALYDGASSYSLDSMLVDPLAMDGVSCAACHQIQDYKLGLPESFSGHFQITDARVIYGPYENPISGPMSTMINYGVEYSEHITQSEMCATCHTLFTPFVDDNGNIAGEAPEQVPYLEWVNSDFPAQGIECQTCHMPIIDEAIVISSQPPWLNSRNPLHAHEFVGGNVFMLKLLRDFGSELGVTASSVQFDSTIARTMKMLTRRTVELDLGGQWNNSEDTLKVLVAVQNLSGHKFPTAYPSRRAWVELKVMNELNEVVFHSGARDETGEIAGLDSSYEMHHQTITSAEQVQVYQNIPKDINGEKTYTLLRIAGYLKDNRIPPKGYLSTGIAADSTRVEGLAENDPDFNRTGSTEGTGLDVIHFHLTDLDPTGNYRIVASMNYQTIAPRFAADLFNYNVPKVAEFQSYYEQMELAPIQLASVNLSMAPLGLDSDTGVQPFTPLLVETYPNPFNPEVNIRLTLEEPGYLIFMIYDIQGRIIQQMSSAYHQAGINEFRWDARNINGELVQSGVYLLQVEQRSPASKTVTRIQKKLVYLK